MIAITVPAFFLLLLEIVDDAGVEAIDHAGIALGVPLTQTELGDLINVSRQTVEHILQDWRNRGIVSTGPKEIVLIDLPCLRRVAGTRLERA
jgi:CRP-like cAMP-binding protein